MPKTKGLADQPPTSYPNTTPPTVGTDVGSWLLNATTEMRGTLGRVEGTLVGLQAQVDRVETKLDAIKTDVRGHGNWIHTLKFSLLGIGILIGWAVVFAVGPWVKSKFLPGP